MYIYVFPRCFQGVRQGQALDLYYSLSLFDMVSLDIILLLDCYAIGMTGRLCVSDGAIHYRIPFM